MVKITRGRKTKDTPPAPPAPTPRPMAPRAPESVKQKTKILLSVADGKIQWDAMSPEARRMFEELFANPKFQSEFGLTAKRGGWSADQVKYIYAGIGQLNQTIALVLMRWPKPAAAILGFTPEELDALGEPTAAVANRYSTKFLQEHQELAIWAATFFAIMQGKMIEGGTLAKEIRAREARDRAARREFVTGGAPPTPPAAPPPPTGSRRVVISTPPATAAPPNGHGDPEREGMSLDDLPSQEIPGASLERDDDIPGAAVLG